MKSFSADDQRFRYQGRVDWQTPSSPKLIWQGTTVTVGFEGESVALVFSKVSGEVYFDVKVDNETRLLKAKNGSVTLPFDLSYGKHNISLFKRTEASKGHVHFDGIQVDGDLVASPEHTYAKRFIFYGDSITAGACNEDAGEDQWEDYSTHNNAKSFAALTARAMDAEYRNIAVSGMGISLGYEPHTFADVWDKYLYDPFAKKADVSGYQADTVFIYLGQNDASFTKNNELPFPNDFGDRFIRVLKQIRAAYPQARIVLLRGGMSESVNNERFVDAWETFVRSAKQSDPNVLSFVFEHWVNYHPRVEDHALMAEELVNWLNKAD